MGFVIGLGVVGFAFLLGMGLNVVEFGEPYDKKVVRRWTRRLKQ